MDCTLAMSLSVDTGEYIATIDCADGRCITGNKCVTKELADKELKVLIKEFKVKIVKDKKKDYGKLRAKNRAVRYDYWKENYENKEMR